MCYLINMKFTDLMTSFRDRPFFESRDLKIYFSVPDDQVGIVLSRWVKQGKIVQLRKSKYLLAEPYRRKPASQEFIANYLYRPSYVSLQRALYFYNLIPEAVGPVQSVTPRGTRSWETEEGVYEYRSIKKERFWGYHKQAYSSDPAPQEYFLIARPEKALLDTFYFHQNEWTEERIREMRFQNREKINFKRLNKYTEKFASPRIDRAVGKFVEIYRKEPGNER